jgi:hypothetical protein
MPRRNKASVTFDRPDPREHYNDMIFQFLTSSLTDDNVSVAPLGFDPAAIASPGSLANGNAIAMVTAGTIRTFYAKGDANALTATESYTIEKNGSSTAIVATTVIGSPAAADNTHSISVAQGDIISVRHDVTGSPNFTEVSIGFLFLPL